MKALIGQIIATLRRTIECWNADRAPQLAAALAFYTTFSLTPVLLITISVVGLAFGRDSARMQVMAQITDLVGAEGSQLIESLLENASQPDMSTFAAIIGTVTLLFGAAGVFGQIKAMLQIIWNVHPPAPPNTLASVMSAIRRQLFSVSMVLIAGFLMLVSLAASAILTAASTYISDQVAALAAFAEIVNFVLTLLITTLIFASLFKYVPGARISWREVLPGAFITAILFTLGRTLLSAYLGRTSFSSTYGAAGSLVLLLSWVYYSAQILFFGAELTHVMSTPAAAPTNSTEEGSQSQPIMPSSEIRPV